jgi:hypothetical protein
MKRSFAVLAFLAVLPAAPAARGEDGAPIPAGTRVRLTSMGAAGLSGTMEGALVRLAPGMLGVVDAERGSLVTVPEATVIRVQTSRGPRRHVRTGFIIGAVTGATAMIAVTGTGDCSYYMNAPCTLENRVAWVAFGGGFYGGVGALIGHFIRTEHWSDARVDRVKVAIRPEHGGGRVAVAVSF